MCSEELRTEACITAIAVSSMAVFGSGAGIVLIRTGLRAAALRTAVLRTAELRPGLVGRFFFTVRVFMTGRTIAPSAAAEQKNCGQNVRPKTPFRHATIKRGKIIFDQTDRLKFCTILSATIGVIPGCANDPFRLAANR
jgi:hypothetical protein